MNEPIIKFREYQRPVFEDNETGILVLHWSRQIGKSFTIASWAVDRLLTRPGRLVTVLSNSKDNGQEFALKCSDVCRKIDEAKKKVIEEYKLKDLSTSVEYSDMRFEITIKVKGLVGRIKVLAANPRTARGFSGDLILDEFAFHEDSAAIWDAAEPILSSNPDFLCRVASTGNGTGNMFYRMATEGQFKVSKVRRSDAWRMGVKIYDAKTRQPITPDEARAQALDKESYDQNYECTFASETGALLTHELINRATDNTAQIFDIDESAARSGVRALPDGRAASPLAAVSDAIADILDRASSDGLMVYGGGDVACTRDYAVYPFAALVGSCLKTLFILRVHGTRIPQQRQMLEPILAHRAVVRLALDSSGIGLGLTQELEDEFRGKVMGVNFAASETISERLSIDGRKKDTAPVKELMATDLCAWHEDARLTYPCDAVMREDLRKPTRIRTKTGRVSIAAERDANGHADHFWGLALLVRAVTHGHGDALDPVVGNAATDPDERTI